EETVKYAIRLVRETRPDVTSSELIKDMVECGASPRASQALIMGAKARAALEGRDEAMPSDMRAIALPALHHRILTNFHADADRISSRDLVRQLIKDVPRPAFDEAHYEHKPKVSVVSRVINWLMGAPAPKPV
ncbi:MAG: AAA family ATPase, partial [Planctomycetota bacterium]